MRSRAASLIFAALLCYSGSQAADRNIEPIVSRIHREPVDSSALAAAGYSRRLHVLEIQFRDGLIYRYEEVPPALYRQLIAAESKARFYNNNIRGKFHCVRVRPARAR